MTQFSICTTVALTLFATSHVAAQSGGPAPEGTQERSDCQYRAVDMKIFCPIVSAASPPVWRDRPEFRPGEGIVGTFRVAELKEKLSKDFQARIQSLEALETEYVYVPPSMPSFAIDTPGPKLDYEKFLSKPEDELNLKVIEMIDRQFKLEEGALDLKRQQFEMYKNIQPQ